jgi:hypothetical protein
LPAHTFLAPVKENWPAPVPKAKLSAPELFEFIADQPKAELLEPVVD